MFSFSSYDKPSGASRNNKEIRPQFLLFIKNSRSFLEKEASAIFTFEIMRVSEVHLQRICTCIRDRVRPLHT